MQIITSEDAKKKLDELESFGPYHMYSDEATKIRFLYYFLEQESYFHKLRENIKEIEYARNAINREIRRTKEEAKKLDLISLRNEKNRYLREDRAQLKKEKDKLKFYAYQAHKIIKGDWTKADLPKEYL